MTNGFVDEYLAETVEILGRIDRDALDAMAVGLAEVARRRRSALHPRRRRLGRPREPRGQRLPQDLRFRGLHPDRQRLGADRPHQRRRLGRRVRGAGSRSHAWAPTDAVLVFSVGGGNREQERVGRISSTRSNWPATSASSIYGIVGRDGGYTARGRRRVRRDPAAVSRAGHAAHRRSVPRWCGTCSSRTRRCSGTSTKWESVR